MTTPGQVFDSALVTRLALFALAVYVARAGLQFLRSYMAHVAGWGVVAESRKLVYEHLQSSPCAFTKINRLASLCHSASSTTPTNLNY